jgi:glycosyltransferase involved in cell wall biosynthesis
MPILTFIMPVRNGVSFIQAAVRSIREQSFRDWEMIVVDDHSTDGTSELVRSLLESDVRIRVVENPGFGQVQAINHGYTLCSGRYLKIIDSDDLLSPGFSAAFECLTSSEAVYHDALLWDEASGRLDRLCIGSRFQDLGLEQSLRRIMISPPRWSWTISRRVADRVFPLPAHLTSPHEDVYFGLMIKKNADVRYMPFPLYVYRQHGAQFYGGLFNFSPQAVTRRAEAMLRIIRIVEESDIVKDLPGSEKLLAFPRAYYSLLARSPLSMGDIFRSRLAVSEKARVAFIRKVPRLASWLSRQRALRRTKVDMTEVLP